LTIATETGILHAVKILHISTADNGGGAARSAYRLHDGLRRSGQHSRMYVLDKYTNDPWVTRFQSSHRRIDWIARNARRLRLNLSHRRYAKTSPPEQTFFSEDRTPFYGDACRQMPETELINLHWVAGFLDLGAFFAWLRPGMPLVWTLHDMGIFTGGCSQDLGCGKFTQQCGACPQLGSSDESDLTRDVWRRKKKYYSTLHSKRLHIVTPSRWLGEQVKRSPLLSRFSRSVIPYGLDLEVFKPRDRHFSREVLGIPQDAKVILFVSNGLHTHLKGFKHLVGALEGVSSSSGIFLLCLGFGSSPAIEQFPHAHIPSMTNDRSLSMVYSAADVFVLPSLADNLPNTMLEALACGTPVVGFATGGIPDGVRPEVTGLLAKTGDSAELRAAILKILNNDARRAEMSANCRRVAVAEYDLSLQTSRYVEIYKEMLGRGAGAVVNEVAAHRVAANSNNSKGVG
jgi:glycosyltransferase involved in cell wall biosynthesis